MAKRKRKSCSAHDSPKRALSLLLLFKDCAAGIRRHFDATLLVLAIMHLIFFLVLVASIANLNTRRGPRVFGAAAPTVSETSSQDETRSQPVPPLQTAAYSAYTLLLWGLLTAFRRRMDSRQKRFIILLLAPGTITLFYALARLTLFKS